MGIRSKIAMLPPAVHSELDRLIVERAFSGYDPLAEWLQAKGYYVADVSVQGYGVRLRQQLEAIELCTVRPMRSPPQQNRPARPSIPSLSTAPGWCLGTAGRY